MIEAGPSSMQETSAGETVGVASVRPLTAKALAERIGRSDRWVHLRVRDGMPVMERKPCPGGEMFLFDEQAVKAWLREQGMPEVAMRRARRGDATHNGDSRVAVGDQLLPGQAEQRALEKDVAMGVAMDARRTLSPSHLLSASGELDTGILLVSALSRLASLLNAAPKADATAHEASKFADAMSTCVKSVFDMDAKHRERVSDDGSLIDADEASRLCASHATMLRTSLQRAVLDMVTDVCSAVTHYVPADHVANVRAVVRESIVRHLSLAMQQTAEAVVAEAA